MKAKWYGVYTRINCEKKVSDFLTRRKIENFYPAVAVPNKWSFIKKYTTAPILPSYIFVHTDEDQIATIKNFPDVINFLYWIGKPVIIQDAEIEIMKSISAGVSPVKVQKSKINLEKIDQGPKISSSEVDGVRTFKVTIRSIGYSIITQIDSPKLSIFSSQGSNHGSETHGELLNQHLAN